MSFPQFSRIPISPTPGQGQATAPTIGALVRSIHRKHSRGNGLSLPCSLIILLAMLVQVVGVPVVSAHVAAQAQRQATYIASTVPFNADVQHLRKMVHDGQL